LDPAAYGFAPPAPATLSGGDPAANAAITRAILSGEDRGPRREVVVLNAAAALRVGDKAETIDAGIAQAEASLDSGAALRTLDALIAFSQQCATAS
jgi:anthranilate phosphoribosyltransferase